MIAVGNPFNLASTVTAGIVSAKAFIIIRVNGKPVNSVKDFLREIQDKKGGIMLEGVYPDRPEVYYYAFGL